MIVDKLENDILNVNVNDRKVINRFSISNNKENNISRNDNADIEINEALVEDNNPDILHDVLDDVEDYVENVHVNDIKVCHLNVNGWTNANGVIRKKIIEYSNADIFCINESHLTPKTSLEGEVFGYQWIGHNRPHSHVNAKRCHGGVGMFVKKCIMHNFYTNIVDKEYDGILAVKFVNKITEYTFIVISCYLPPEYSKWGRDSTSFFNHLVMLLYSYESDMTIMAGDVNSRIGNLEDCIDKENIPVREILDETKNQHGIAFVEFLKETSCCVLNGRIDSSRNDFTSVTSKGKSVVDYIMVPVTDFKCCKRFSVESCTEISSKIGLQEHINIRSKLPDHSLLSMYFSFESNIKLERKESVLDSKNSYKYNCIPNDFLLDEEGRKYLESMIVNITLCKENQENVDSLYSELLTGLVKEFDRRIPIRPKRGISKQVKVRHPFWNAELENKWQEVCRAEKLLRKCTNRLQKRNLRHEYKCAQDTFDKYFRKCKRLFQREKKS